MKESRSDLCKRIMSVILSIVLVLSTIQIGPGQGFVFAAGSKYIFEYDGEAAASAISGFTKVNQFGKTGALQFKNNKTETVLWNGSTAVSSGITVFELEMLPASSCDERVKIYNSAGDELFEITNYGTNKGKYKITSGGGATTVKDIGTPTVNKGSNLWTKLRIEFYLDENVVDDSGKKVLQYKISVMEAPAASSYTEDYSRWNEFCSITQADVIGNGYANGIYDQNIDGSEAHPFDIAKITVINYASKNKRWIGDVRLSSIMSVAVSDFPESQIKGNNISVGEAKLAIGYSTGVTEYIALSDLTYGTDYTITGFDKDTAGNQNITITYLGKEIQKAVTVKELQGIEVTPPSQNYVEKGASLDTSDMTVEAVFSDSSRMTLGSADYTLTLDTLTTGAKTARVTLNSDDSFYDEFDVIVTIAAYQGSMNAIFNYSDGAADVDELGMTITTGSQISVNLVTDDVVGNTTQKVKLVGGSMIKNWGYDITSGIVKSVTWMNANGGNAFYRMLDKDGNVLISIGQSDNTGLYDAASSNAFTAVTGSHNNWIRLETEIDLDASNSTGVLQFVTKIYEYTDEWQYKATLTPQNYQNDVAGNTNGCATGGLSTFSVGSVEYATMDADNADGVYFDNMYIAITQAAKLIGVSVKTMPQNTAYAKGSTADLDLTGLELTEAYNNLFTNDISDLDTITANYDITGFDTSNVGTNTITVTNKNDSSIKTTFDVTIRDITLESITVQKKPDKLEYVVGSERLNTAGIIVKASYSDGSNITLTDEEYTVSTPDFTAAGTKTVTVTAIAKNESGDDVTTSFTIDVVAVQKIFSYDGNATGTDELLFELGSGAAVSLATTAIKGHSAQKLKVTGGALIKKWGYDIESGIVRFETEFNRNSKSAFFTVNDKNGKALITIGQFSNTNVYTALDSSYSTSGVTEFDTLVNNTKENWIRLETEIDLDESNSTGVLSFATKIYVKADYSGEWTYKATLTAADYQGGNINHANGAATAGITSFSVSSVEYATRSDNSAGAYFDELYIGATEALSNVAVKTEPTKQEYAVGATGTLDLTGLVLTETYGAAGESDENSVTVIEKNYNITGFDVSSTGTKTITITNKTNPDISTSFDIEVKNVTLKSIKVTTNPDKLTYYVGGATTPDVTGIVVTATYSDNSTGPLSAEEYTVGEVDTSTTGPKRIKITAVAKNAEGNAVETEYEVTVITAAVTGIEITTLPNKVQYIVGNSLDLSGLVVTASYNSGNSKTVELSELIITGFDSSAVADAQTITVSYNGFTDDFTIQIIDASAFTVTEFGFDFNIAGSTATNGWTNIFVNKKGGTTYKKADYGYTAEKGYGFSATTIDTLTGRNESSLANPAYSAIPASVYKDYVLFGAAKGTFDVDMPAGTYNVQIIVGTTNPNTTTVKIENKEAYTGSVTIGDKDTKMFKVIEIPGVVVSDGQMNIAVTADSNARTSAIIISNVAAPSGVTAAIDMTAAASGKSAVALTWNGTPGCTGYNVYRVSSDGTTKRVCTLNGIMTTTYTDETVDSLETYTYFVRGISANGFETIASNEAEIMVYSDTAAAPATPTDFKISAMDFDTTTLTWSASNNVDSYFVYGISVNAYDTDSLSGYTLLGKTASTTYVCDLEEHAEMYYKLVAVGIGGESEATGKAISDEAAPDTPVNLKVASVTDNKTTLTWDASERAAYYEVYWSDRERADLSGTEGYKLLTKTSDTSFEYELSTHIERYYKVIAVGKGGKSAVTTAVKSDIVKEFNVQAEWLDRGLIAISVDGGVYVGWRLLGDEYAAGASYKLYRDGACIRTFTATENTSFLDTAGTADSKYAVSVVIGGIEGTKCSEVAVQSTDYLEVRLNVPDAIYDDKLTKEHIKSKYYGNSKFVSENILTTEEKSSGTYRYAVNDTYVGDVDGDGVYELIVKWSGMTRDNSEDGYTSPVIIDCYKLDGTQLWRINLGWNIRAGAHYTQPVVADLDGDGKAEIMMRTADGSVDGKGTVIGDADADYRNSRGHIIEGTDYLTLFDGETGEALDTINYVPQRGSASDWGDNYGGRSERFLSGAAYLDGEHISAVFARGYYCKAVVAAFDVVNKRIVTRWICSSDDEENKSLYGQGAHSFTVADVDGDGCQEIIYGSATIDHNGKLMYSGSDYGANYGGHGDALRVTDMNLKNPGLEVFMVHEEYPNNASVEMHDGATGEYIYKVATEDQDVGRGAAGDIDPRYEGVETWSTVKNTDTEILTGLRDAEGNIIAKRPSSVNHMAWFNGDMGREFVDNTGSVPYIGTWNYASENMSTTLLTGCRTNNTTKANPCFQADMFGDWREELGFRTEDNSAIRIYTSTEVMDYRLYTLMHDPTYRAQMACNGSAYNQSPDAGFYIGYDTDLMVVPVPTLEVVKATDEGAAVITSIVVEETPDKLVYITGEALDLSGMVVVANYNNNTRKVLTEGYTVDSSAFNSETAGTVCTITVEYATLSDDFKVRIINAEDKKSFYYIDADSIEDLDITVSDGGTLKVADTAKNGNDTNKLEVASGTISKKFDTALTFGKVTLEYQGYQNSKVMSVRILDADGNALISTAQQTSGNFNLYENKATSGNPFMKLCTAKNKWLKVVTVIDLDKSNETGILHFEMDVYYKNSYDAASWTKAGTFTQDNTYVGGDFGHTNGAASDSLTGFSVGAIEFQSNGSSYIDDIYFNDGSGIGDIVSTEKELLGIAITKPAALKKYTVGSELNTDGLEITGTYKVTYSDGREPEIKQYVIKKYDKSYDFSRVTDNAVVTITVMKGETPFTVTYSVQVVPKSDGSYAEFEYVDEESAALVGLSGNNLSITGGQIAATDTTNLTNRITVAKGTAKKLFDTPFTTGTVHFETAFMTMSSSKASLFLRIKNSEGKSLIDIAQYGSSNLNLYIDENTSGTTGTMAGQFKDLPVKKWAKFEVDIDLDKTRANGYLVFDAAVWVTDDYSSGNWTKFAEFDETLYLDSTMAPTTTGSASSTATVFDIASIELYNADGALNYYDDMYFEAMGTGVSKKLYKIEITSEATKKVYTEGDDFNASGLVVMGTWNYVYKDGTTGTKKRPVTNYDVTFDGMTIGNKIPVTISVGKKTVSYNVSVVPNMVLDGIERYIVDYVNNDLVTLAADGSISINKRQIRLPYADADDIKLEYAAVSSNVSVNNRIMTVTPSSQKIKDAVLRVSVVVKNSDGRDVTIKRDVVFKVARASSQGGGSQITFDEITDYEEVVSAMMDKGLFKDQERLNSVSAIISQLDEKITVEEFVAILVNLFEVDTTYTDTEINRDDIDYNAWYAQYIIAAFQLSMETEESRTGKESFGIGDSLTKEDVIYMLSRIIAIDKTTLPSDYADKMFE